MKNPNKLKTNSNTQNSATDRENELGGARAHPDLGDAHGLVVVDDHLPVGADFLECDHCIRGNFAEESAGVVELLGHHHVAIRVQNVARNLLAGAAARVQVASAICALRNTTKMSKNS